MVTLVANGSNLLSSDDLDGFSYDKEDKNRGNESSDNKDLYALFIIPKIGVIVSAVAFILRRMLFQIVAKIFTSMEPDEEEEADDNLSISSSNIDTNENLGNVSSDTSSEDDIMIIDAAVQTSFKSDANDIDFEDD